VTRKLNTLTSNMHALQGGPPTHPSAFLSWTIPSIFIKDVSGNVRHMEMLESYIDYILAHEHHIDKCKVNATEQQTCAHMHTAHRKGVRHIPTSPLLPDPSTCTCMHEVTCKRVHLQGGPCGAQNGKQQITEPIQKIHIDIFLRKSSLHPVLIDNARNLIPVLP
jgi:hypothetical protein